jgi:dihydrofolate synthase/folylpolyglutamate synthase
LKHNLYDTASFQEVENKLEALASPGIHPGLARVDTLLSLVGNPSANFKAVHVVGTNGKGSVAAYLESILRNSSYTTALYTSPHLVSFGERLFVNGKEASPEQWMKALKKIESAISSSPLLLDDRPTFFELATVAAFMIIAETGVEIAVIEAGLGGRLDATNRLEDTVLTLITSIGMDHTFYLGEKITEIADEKFAVMKKGIPAIFVGGETKVDTLYSKRAEEKTVPADFLNDLCTMDKVKSSLRGTEFSLVIKGADMTLNIHSPLGGLFQSENASLAAVGAFKLMSLFKRITAEKIEEGISKVYWPGRLEIIAENPLTAIDGAHNPHAMARLAQTLTALYKPGELSIVIAAMKDKDIQKMLLALKPLEPLMFCTEIPDTDRSFDATTLLEHCDSCGLYSVGSWSWPKDAITAARSHGRVTICCGSLYLVGWIKGHLGSDGGL